MSVRIRHARELEQDAIARYVNPAFPSTAMDLLDHKGGASSMMRDAVL